METWIILIIISTISVAFARVIQKLILNNEKVDSVALSIVFQTLTAILIFFSAIYFGSTLSGYENKVPNIILGIFLYTAFNYLLFSAYKKGEASTVSLILSSSTVWTILYSVIFLNEILSINDIIGIVLIALAIILVNFEGVKNINKVGHGEILALFAGACVGIALGNDFYIIGEKSPYAYAAFSFLAPAIATSFIFYRKVPKIKEFLNKKTLFLSIVLSIFYAISLISLLRAYQSGGQASEITPISQTSVFIIIFLSAIFLNEKKNLTIKIIASVIALVGVIFTVANVF